jgi:integrase
MRRPNHRKSIAEALTDATEAMLVSDNSPYPADEIRRALRTWAFSDRLRGATEPPVDLAAVVRWLETATVPVAELSSPGLGAARCRVLLDRVSRKQDGTAAAANTANRKRAVLNNLMQHAVEVGALSANPLKAVKWTRPRTLKTVDPRTVVNSDQARRLLAAVGQQGERGERMVAFFGCMYYAALRPEEAVELRPDNLASLPDHGWGELILTNSEPRSGTWWTDSGSARQRRELKHRPPGETRPVPIHPELVVLLSEHLKKYRPGRAHLHRPTRRHLQRPGLPQDLPPGPRHSLHWPGSSISASQAPLRSAARSGLHLAERRSARTSGR